MPDFHGLPTESVDSPFLRIEYLTTAGPRIVRLFAGDGEENLLAEVPDMAWEIPQGRFHLRGGHRLWVAPETLQNECQPDNDPVKLERGAGWARLTGPMDPVWQLTRSIELRLHPERVALTVIHRVSNGGRERIRLAPWGITQLPLGGLAAMPQAIDPSDAGGFLPNRSIALWPYTKLKDARLTIENDLIFLAGEAAADACKVGCRNPQGWLAYWRGQHIFVKHSAFEAEAVYPDFGCNTELYVLNRFIELETLGPLVELAAGQEVSLAETWEIFPAPDLERSREALQSWCNSTLTADAFPI